MFKSVKKVDVLIGLTFVLAIFLRWFMFHVADPMIFDDTASYAGGSKFLAKTFSFAKLGNQRPFLYPAIIGLIHSWFNDSNRVVVLMQYLFGLGSMGLLLLVCRKIFTEKGPAFAALMLYVCNMHLLGFEKSIMADSLHVFTTLLYLLLFLTLVLNKKMGEPKDLFRGFFLAFLVGFVFFLDVALRQISQFTLALLLLFIFVFRFVQARQQISFSRMILQSCVETAGVAAGFVLFLILISAKMKVDTGIFGLTGVVERFPTLFKGNGLLAKYFSLPLSYLSLCMAHPIEMFRSTISWTNNMVFRGSIAFFFHQLKDFHSIHLSTVVLKPFLLPKYLVKVILAGMIETKIYISLGLVGALLAIKKWRPALKEKGGLDLLLILSIVVLHIAVAVSYWAQTDHSGVTISSYRLNLEPLLMILAAYPLYFLWTLFDRLIQTRFAPIAQRLTVSFFSITVILFVSILFVLVKVGLSATYLATNPSILGIVPWNNGNDTSVFTEFACAFSTPMDKTTVQKALYLKDLDSNQQLIGKSYWNGDSYLVFIPNDPLTPSHRYEWGFESGASSTRQLPLTGFSLVRFQAEPVGGATQPYNGCDRRTPKSETIAVENQPS